MPYQQKKNKNSVIMSQGAEKSYKKIQHSIIIKTLNKQEMQRNFLHLRKNYEKSTLESCLIIKYWMFPPKFGDKAKMHTTIISI